MKWLNKMITQWQINYELRLPKWINIFLTYPTIWRHRSTSFIYLCIKERFIYKNYLAEASRSHSLHSQMVSGHFKSVVLPQFTIFYVFFASCKSQYTSEYKPQNVNWNEPSKDPPIPRRFALSSTYLTYLAKIEVDIYEEMVGYAQALQERLATIHE